MGDKSLIYKLNQVGAFDDRDFPVDVFDLIPEKIDCLEDKHIVRRLHEVLSYNYYGKTIEYSDIIEPLRSKYCSRILDAIAYYDYKILGVSKYKEIEEMIIERGIEFIKKEQENIEYIPFEHGCFHESDIGYIKDNKIGYLEVSKYPDGWHSCLPFVDIYSIYDINEIKKNYLKIIHNAIFARVSDGEYIGNWYLLLGNIPRFVEKYNIDIDWGIMYGILKWFLKESLICDLDV